MAEQKLKEGDIVVIKSGGPSMTIDHFDVNDRAVCFWFDSNGVKQRIQLYPESLKLADDSNNQS